MTYHNTTIAAQGAAQAEKPKALGRDRFFDPWRAPRSPNAKALVADVTRELENYECHRKPRGRRRPQYQAVFEETVSAIVCDLAHPHLSGVEGGIAITRSNRELAKRSRYRSRVLGKTLPRVLDHLSSPEMEFVEQTGGYLNPFARNQRTLIRPERRLLTRIEDRRLGLNDIGRSTSEEIIILKANKEDFW